MLSSRKAVTQADLEEYFELTGDDIHMSHKACSKSRDHYDHTSFEKVFSFTRDLDYAVDVELSRFLGFKLFTIAGSQIPLPNNPVLRDEFGTIGAGSATPTARASIAYDINNDQIIDAAITPMSVGECKLAVQHLDAIKNIIHMADTLFIFDKGYTSEELIRKIVDTGALFLMRVRKEFSPAVDNTPVEGGIVSIGRDIKVRVVKFLLPSGEEETLISNLFQLAEGLFKPLYFKRWPVEVKYDIVKNKLKHLNFTGCSSNVIRQDFWISMLLANVAAAAKREADKNNKGIRTGINNKYDYQANTNIVIASLRSRFADAVFDEEPVRRKYKTALIMREVAHSVIPMRSDRNISDKQNTRKI